MKTKLKFTSICIWGFISVACSKNYPLPVIHIDVNWFADNSKSNHSSAAYGDYLVLIPQSRNVIYLHNLKDKRPLYTLTIGAGTGINIWEFVI